MAKKVDPNTVALSLAGVSAIFSLSCALIVSLAPDFSLRLARALFHGLEISGIAAPTINDILAGLGGVTIIAILSGWLFALFYNFITTKR
ncbi:MAG TPA: DUF5676 family membrane protein [Candidatus Nanoarchaeia archaeon]|nr:DUF5676 family membrane protein [Candidatus Nanoarchaeia archaeon]